MDQPPPKVCADVERNSRYERQSRGETVPLLHPTVGKKLDIECRGEARREGMNEDEQISNTHTHVEVRHGRYY